MSLIAKEGATGDFQRFIAPADSHASRCIGVIDMGTQETTYEGETKHKHRVRIVWELPEVAGPVFGEDGKPVEGQTQPARVGREYTLSLHKNAELRGVLEAWRGKPFTAEELEGFDISKLIGAPSLLTIVHQPKHDNTGVYAKVTQVGKLPKGMSIPDQHHPSERYSIEDGRNDIFLALPEYMQKRISACREWQNEPANAAEPVAAVDDDDVPF